MAFAVTGSTGGLSWHARPNVSFSRRGRRILLLAVSGVSLAIALVFAAFGAWLVLPFAGAELAALWFGLRCLDRHQQDYETVSLSDGRLHVEVRSGSTCRQEDCAACWMRFFLCRPDEAGSLRLRFRAYGRHIDVGRWMSEDEVVAVSTALREAVCQSNNAIFKEGK